MGSTGGRLFLGLGVAVVIAACGSSNNRSSFDGGGLGDGGTDGSVFGGDDSPFGDDSSGGSLLGDGSRPDSGTVFVGDPVTCAQAEASRSYIGCDYWPTVLANNVWSIFDYAVVVANAGTAPASITVTGPGGVNQTATVAAAALTKIYLPWVSALKGTDSDSCGSSTPLAGSVLGAASAYHLVSTVPVTVYQFNALEYKGAGGPAGKSWAGCLGNTRCTDVNSPNFGAKVGCFSFSNDASLLLPSTAMTGNYRVMGHEGFSTVVTGAPCNACTAAGGTCEAGGGCLLGVMGTYATITAIQDKTTVTVTVSGTGHVIGGTGITDTPAKGVLTLAMNAGDVAELVSDPSSSSDLSGSVVAATCGGVSCPVQVLTGAPCLSAPADLMNTCDHIEEANFPAETLGKDYVVTVPTGPNATPVGHQVRIYGDFDGTTLTYNPSMPAGCPATIGAGQVVECGIVTADFEVQGSQPFGVGSFMESGGIVDPNDPNGSEGDPSESFTTAVEQYRTKYVFLGPDDYDFSFGDVVAPAGTTLNLDGVPVTATGTTLGTSGYEVYRLPLGTGQAGAHVLTSSKPVGLQVIGYGRYTSYQYPGGLNLQQIAPPPPPVN